MKPRFLVHSYRVGHLRRAVNRSTQFFSSLSVIFPPQIHLLFKLVCTTRLRLYSQQTEYCVA